MGINDRLKKVARFARYALPVTAIGFMFLLLGLQTGAGVCFPIGAILIAGSLLVWLIYAVSVGANRR